MRKLAFIMRGVPGSGKSTLARLFAGEIGKIHSTDFYFNGVFNPTRLAEFHERNFEAFLDSLAKGAPIVICDNTNSRRAEYERYVKAAEEAGYLVAIVAIPHPDPEIAAMRNIHGVRADYIREMIARWES